MASLNIRNLTLNQTSAFGTKKPDLAVASVVERYKRDPDTRQATTEVEGYNINVLSPRTGETQTVKLPLDVKETFEKIRESLNKEMVVKVNFNGTFKAKFWAMITPEGRVNQGLTATATELQIVSVEALDDDLDVDFD